MGRSNARSKRAPGWHWEALLGSVQLFLARVCTWALPARGTWSFLLLQAHLPAAPFWSWGPAPSGAALGPPPETLGSFSLSSSEACPQGWLLLLTASPHLSSHSWRQLLFPLNVPSTSLPRSHKCLTFLSLISASSSLCSLLSPSAFLSSYFCLSLCLSLMSVSIQSPSLPVLPSCPVSDMSSMAASVSHGIYSAP